MASDGVHSVTLDEAIAAMRMTAQGTVLYFRMCSVVLLLWVRYEREVQGNQSRGTCNDSSHSSYVSGVVSLPVSPISKIRGLHGLT